MNEKEERSFIRMNIKPNWISGSTKFDKETVRTVKLVMELNLLFPLFIELT